MGFVVPALALSVAAALIVVILAVRDSLADRGRVGLGRRADL